MMVNFTSQFDWATRYPGIWSNNTLAVTMMMFLDEFNI